MIRENLTIRRTRRGRLVPIVSGHRIVGVTGVSVLYQAGGDHLSEVVIRVMGRLVTFEDETGEISVTPTPDALEFWDIDPATRVLADVVEYHGETYHGEYHGE